VSVPAALDERSFDGERVTVIKPRRGWAPLDIRELWAYRDVLFFLVWRDVKIRYKQTAIGAGWVILQPFLTAAIFTLVFGHFAGLQAGGVPYALLTYTALLPWLLFANALATSTKSIVENQALVTKVYVPRIFIPVAPVLSGLIDFAVGAIPLVILMAHYRVDLTLRLLTLPFFLLFAVLTAVAVQYTVPFIVQAWFFATPVAYSALVFPADLRMWLGLNPMAGVVQGFRWAIIGEHAGQVGHLMLLSFAVVLLVLVGGIEYFRRVERSFADVV
jgi:lipopolysaccharide transport system permease protein